VSAHGSARAWGISLLVLLAGCGEGRPELEPILETPPFGSGAYPWDRVDELRISVGRVGEEPLVEAAFDVGAPLVLGDIPFSRELVVHVSGRRGGAETAYGRTCAVDVTPEGASETRPRLWFSRLVRWSPAPPPTPRRSGHGYALPDGSALFLGGSTEDVEHFDPTSTGDFATMASTAAPLLRTGAVLVPVLDGRAFVIGGRDEDGEGVQVVELFDPRGFGLDVERVAGPALVEHAGATLVDGTGMIAGGLVLGGAGEPAPTTSAWHLRPPVGDLLETPRQLAVGLSTARAGHSLTRLGNEVGADVLVIGGRDAEGEPVAQTEVFRPLSEVFESVEGALLAVPRWGHRALRLPGGHVLVVGGLTARPGGGDPLPVDELELYDPVQGRFTAVGRLPSGAGLTEHSVTRLPDGRLLLAGGRDAVGNEVASSYIIRLDPIDGRVNVSPTDRLGEPRAGHSAVLLCDGTVLVAGSDSGAGAGAERYNPPSVSRR
jgi:hypothetical protein